MKKFILASSMALIGASMSAQSVDDIRVYINPGHGSWTGNDRPCQIIGKPAYSATNTDTTGFFESNTDLIKGFGVLETLIKMGVPFDRTLNQEGERWEVGAAKDLSQNIVMSRVKNGPFEANNTTSSPNYMQYNRSLPEIAAEVEYNEFDIFISIHSNAATEASATNYHLFMYRGKNGIQNVLAPGSWEMIEAASKYSFPNKHASWSHSNVYINGDVDFMGGGNGSTSALGYYGYLGVLKHGCPGYLVEGYFHTYQPARHRGMNWDVDFEEGSAYARGVAEYFEFDRDKTGDIYGIVRDQHEKFTHNLYKPRAGSNDIWKPLNGVKVYLHKDGNVIKEYTTDNFYNGAFVFFNLEPGDYTITFEHPDYKDLEPQEVTVVPGDCVYPMAFLENKEWVTPDDLKFNYPDELGTNTAYGAMDEYAFSNAYTDQAIAELAGKTVRRPIVKGEKLYALALDTENKPTIVVYDLTNKKVLATPSTEGMQGNILNCSDIALTADGVLVACNQEKLQYNSDYVDAGETRGTLRVYRWENDLNGLPTGNPVQMATSQNTSLWYRTRGGNTLTYSGTIDDGSITIGNPNFTAPNYQLRTLEITVADGAGVSESVHKPLTPEGEYPYVSYTGEDYKFITSPLDDRKIWIITSKAGIVELDNNTTDQPIPASDATKLDELTDATGATAFKYAGHSYVAVPVKAEAGAAGLTLYDVTDGLSNAKAVTTTGTALDAVASAFNSASGVTVVTRDAATNDITKAVINTYAMRDNKVSRFTTDGVNQPIKSAPYAYAIEAESLNISFSSTGDAPAARIILTPTDGSEAVIDSIGAVTKGKNTVTIDDNILADGKHYNIAVEIAGYPVGSAGVTFTAPTGIKAKSRGGLAWISDTESPNFGHLVTSAGYAQGVTVYAPDMTKVDTYKPEGNLWVASKVNSPYRMGQLNGNVILTDWSDPAAGYWFFDPSKPETTYDILGGTRDNTGAHILDGKSIGGGSTAVAFVGEGAQTTMYTFTEDFPAGNGTMTLARSVIGDTNPWTVEATPFANISGSNLMKGTNVELVAIPEGLIVSQARANGKNVEAEPAFVVVDYDGNIKFNSASLEDKLPSCGSGIAVSADGKTWAISEAGTGIGIWDATWKDNVPTLTKRYIIPGSDGSDEVNQLSFDNAGNLYAWHRSDFGLRAYAVKNDAPVARTDAPKSLLITNLAAVNEIAVDNTDNNAPVEYFNLNGVRVEGGNLVPGVYIRRQGSVATKVVVK